MKLSLLESHCAWLLLQRVAIHRLGAIHTWWRCRCCAHAASSYRDGACARGTVTKALSMRFSDVTAAPDAQPWQGCGDWQARQVTCQQTALGVPVVVSGRVSCGMPDVVHQLRTLPHCSSHMGRAALYGQRLWPSICAAHMLGHYNLQEHADPFSSRGMHLDGARSSL